jgi:hypothetical protein
MMVGDQPVGTGARAESIEQHHLQVAAMDRELRVLVTRRTAQRLLIDQLAEAIEEGGIRGGDRDPRQVGLQPERGQFLGSVRQQVDADPDCPDFGG